MIGKPTEVFLDLYVETFGNIKEVNMVRPAKILMYFCQLYVDLRGGKKRRHRKQKI